MAEKKSEKDWEAESAVDTLIRAEEIRNTPSLLGKAMDVMEKRQKALVIALKIDFGAKTKIKRQKGR